MRVQLAGSRDDRATELLATLGEQLAREGVDVVALGADPADPGPPPITLFVPLPTDAHAFPAGIDVRRTVAICAEHPGHVAFDVTAVTAGASGGALALSRAGALEQRRRGIACQRLELGMASRWWDPSPAPAAGRARDALFVGAHCDRREQVLAANAPSLARLRADVRIGSTWPGSRPLPSGAARRDLIASSATVLDIHPRRPHAFDRVLALEAIGSGALAVFEHGLEPAPLVPGEHLLMVDGSQLGLVAGGLLETPDRIDEMVASARSFAEAELSPDPAVERVLSLAKDVERRASRHERWRRLRRLGRPRREAVIGGGEAPPRPAPGPAGDGNLAARAPARQRKQAALASLEDRARARAKELGERGLDDELRCIEQSPAWADRRPAGVAVCVPVHDDGALAVEALESAIGSAGVDVELLVADDASTDDSLETVRDWLLERPGVPSRLLATAVNRGVGAARNAMLAAASSPLAFMLDADNLLFPHGLLRLAAALDSVPEAAFAYGVLERRRDGRPVGLLSAGPWEPERLRDGNYIDAMALLRRDPVRAAGGFADDRRLHGWEDFDLWCRLAERGDEGVFVPQFVGRYVEREGSLLSVASVDATDAVALLRERSPLLRPSIPVSATAG